MMDAQREQVMDGMALAVMRNAMQRGLTFASALNGVVGDDTIPLLKAKVWSFSGMNTAMNWALVEYCLLDYHVAVMVTNASRGGFRNIGYDELAPNVYYQLTHEEGREDPLIVYVVRLVD